MISNTNDYSSENPFTSTPSSTSIENTFRMAQVLQKKGDYKKALLNYITVCQQIKKLIAINPAACSEIHWVIFSLGNISDIYMEKKDYAKCNAFRSSQKEFMDTMQSIKEENEEDNSKGEISLYSITIASRKYLQCYESFDKALATPDSAPEDPKELVKRLQEAKARDEEARIEELTRLLNEEAERREKECQNSFFNRATGFITQNPLYIILFVILLIVLIFAFKKLKPKKAFKSLDTDARMAQLEHKIHEYEAKHPEKVRERKERMQKIHDSIHQPRDPGIEIE